MLLCTKSHFIKNLVEALDGNEGKGSEAERKASGEQMRTRLREYAAAPNGKDSFVEIYPFSPFLRCRSSYPARLSRILLTICSASTSWNRCRGVSTQIPSALASS